jgi:ribosomal protein S8E
MILTIAAQCRPIGMIVNFSKQELLEYRYNPQNTIYVSFQTLDKNDVIQMRMNNQGFNAEQIKRIYIWRVKPFED